MTTASANRWLDTYERQVKINVKYQEHVQRKIEAHKTRAALVELRKDWIQSQKKNNYRNEYQRLIGELNNSRLPGQTVANIKGRMKHLQTLTDESLGQVGKGEKLDYNALMERLGRGGG